MADHFTDEDGIHGFKARVRRVLGAAVEYSGARWTLFSFEARQAAGHVGKVLAALVVVVLFLALAYVTAWGALIVWSARRWAEGDPTLPLLGAALFHLLAAGGLALWLVKRGAGNNLFAATRQELEEDKQWLNRNKTSRF